MTATKKINLWATRRQVSNFRFLCFRALSPAVSLPNLVFRGFHFPFIQDRLQSRSLIGPEKKIAFWETAPKVAAALAVKWASRPRAFWMNTWQSTVAARGAARRAG